jgi:polysaccharide biosynthesis protein PslH
LRILFLTHRLPYAPNRGDRIRAYHLLRLLAMRHEVHVVSLVHDAEELAQVGTLRRMVASVTGVRVHRFGRLLAGGLALAGSQPLTHVLLHSAGMHGALRDLVRDRPPDVVFAYCTGMARYAIEPPLGGYPWVLDMVDVDSAKWAALAQSGGRLLGPIYRREAALLRAFERRAMSSAVVTTVVSDKERVLLDEGGDPTGPRAVVVSNGIDLASFAPPSVPAADPEVVFCGVFNYAPNEAGAVWLASAVWPRVRRAEPRARLSLVGMHPTRAVRALGADPSIRVTGAVNDVRPYLWGAAVGVAPLHLARGLQNKVLEALAAGLPCVVTPAVLDGLPAAARGGCEAAEEAEAFAEAIVRLLRETPERRRAIASRAVLGGLSWEAQMAPMVLLVEAAGARSGGVVSASSGG